MPRRRRLKDKRKAVKPARDLSVSYVCVQEYVPEICTKHWLLLWAWSHDEGGGAACINPPRVESVDCPPPVGPASVRERERVCVCPSRDWQSTTSLEAPWGFAMSSSMRAYCVILVPSLDPCERPLGGPSVLAYRGLLLHLRASHANIEPTGPRRGCRGRSGNGANVKCKYMVLCTGRPFM